MKKNTRILPLCLLLLGFSNLFAQNIRWSFHIDAGLSHIYTNRKFIDPGGDILFINTSEFENTPSYSFSYGTNADIKLFKNWSLNSGLSLLIMSGIHEVTNGGLISVNGTSNYRNYTTRNVDRTLNFAIPLSLEYNLKRFDIKIGTQALYLLKRKTNFRTTTIENNSTFTLNESSENKLFKKLDYGFIGGISYRLNKYFNIDTNFYWGLNNIIESSVISSDVFKYSRKNRRISLGVSYYINDQNI